MLELDDVQQAQQRIKDAVRRTPCVGVELGAAAAVAALRTGAYRVSRNENLCALVCGSGTDGFE